ncbi:MFS general substrate transporter [Rhizoclosmatium globosum]|uniref:MFS general substrate transporter n=1 Tax=Rhizoclosmatium globosum TaxID=329046 RepID=A0A1Y2C5X2_9FUNG|nr:MFS general substrate transporter [Rhizoclosmatium globosum]|eukprot:ORY42274.1 MFS general substrate transporter [Rhizoclosmatium globosum]
MPSSESDDVVERPLGSLVDPWHRISDVVVLAIGFLFVFMTFTVLQTQASTILDPSVAFKSLGALYVSFAFFNLFAAAAIVERLGCGAALFVSSIGYTLFGAANVAALRLGDDVEAQIAILLPAAVLTGLSASVIWAAQGVYVTRCAASANVGKYTGIFFGVFWWASILGPLLTRVLLAASSDTFYVIAQLTAIGACGPLVLLWLWLARPEPSHPEALQVSTESLVEIPPIRYKFLRTFRIMFTRSMFFLAPLYYSTSVEQAFSGGSLPLFIKSDNPKVDLENKLYLQAIFGTTLMITSFIIGGITDRFGSRPLLVFDLFLHIGTMSIMWFLKPINNLSIIFPCAIALAVSDSLLMNQIYKLVGTLYPQKSETTTAFAAYKFHQSFATGFVFVSSKAMLGENGVPNMGIWTPLISVVLITATAGVFMATEKSVSAREEIVGNDSNERTPLLGSTRISSSESEETPLLGNFSRLRIPQKNWRKSEETTD